MDLFVVPTARFKLLYGFFVIHHGRRLLVHFNTTLYPTAEWLVLQLREAFPFDEAPSYMILDRDSIFNQRVIDALKSMGVKAVRTAYRSPWQNPVGERWIGSLRRELLDHVIVLSEEHLRRLVQEYVSYYNADRCHTTLGGDAPIHRPIQPRSSPTAKVVATPRVGGLHHRYDWRDAA